MIPNELEKVTRDYFAQHSSGYDMSDPDECGRYMEALIPYCQHNGFSKVGHLKKSGGTRYNGHAIDSFLYNEKTEPSGLLQSCDVINRAEAKPPYTPSNPAPFAGWNLDTPRYKESDW